MHAHYKQGDKRKVSAGCMAEMHRLRAVLDMKAPFTTSSSKPHAKNAPRTNSFMLGWDVWDAHDSREPTASRTAQTTLEMNESPKILRRDRSSLDPAP